MMQMLWQWLVLQSKVAFWEVLVFLQVLPWRWIQAALLVELLIIFGIYRALLSHPNDTENDKLWIPRLRRLYWWLFTAYWLLVLIRYTGLHVIAYLVS